MRRNLNIILCRTLCILVLLAGCTSAPDLNTPREIINDRKETVGVATAVSVRQDNVVQTMELIRNRFRCEISEAGPVPVVRLRMELQNTQLSGDGMNSLYFRTEALPIDNALHIIAGDPNGSSPDAVKFIFHEFWTLVPLVPEGTGGTDMFRISLRRSETERTLYGVFTCTAVIPTTSRTVDISGDFTIAY